MIRVINYKVRVNGKCYIKNEIIKCLSKKDEDRLIQLGYAERVGEETSENFVSDLTVDEGKQWADNIDDITLLEDAIIEEKEGKNRKGLLQFIEARIKELSQVD